MAHYHNKSTEFYEILKGKIVIQVGNRRFLAVEGSSFKIEPGEVHFGNGNETWIKVVSKPAWRLRDHILVE